MRLVCSWCWHEKGQNGYPVGPAVARDPNDSHGICKSCIEKNRDALYPEQLQRPRLVVAHSFERR